MNLADVEKLLAELAPAISGVRSDVRIRTVRGRHREAALTLRLLTDAAQYAIVSTPGVGTFGLEVSGRFCIGNADDLATDDDVREYLQRYFRAATAFLEGRWSVQPSRFLRGAILTVHSDDGPLNLARTGHGSSNRA